MRPRTALQLMDGGEYDVYCGMNKCYNVHGGWPISSGWLWHKSYYRYYIMEFAATFQTKYCRIDGGHEGDTFLAPWDLFSNFFCSYSTNLSIAYIRIGDKREILAILCIRQAICSGGSLSH